MSSKYEDLEKLLKRIGSEVADYADVSFVTGQPNIRLLNFTFKVAFDVTEGATEQSVLQRIKEKCEWRMKWLSDLKERSKQ